jgi:hypothetical protein
MLRTLVQARAPVALTLAAATGLWGLQTYPISRDDVFLGLISEYAPVTYRLISYGYATLWFTTPFWVASCAMSPLAILFYSRVPSARSRPLPPFPRPDGRSTLALVLGETHFHTATGRAPTPTWLTIPQRGLYTGIMVPGAVGTGKTSGCMYPYVEQVLRWKADDEDQKVGGLVLEVKGNFCGQVRSILARANRPDDYIEVGLDTGVCYNPLHNDLDPYAVAYAVATLLKGMTTAGAGSMDGFGRALSKA